MKTVRWSLVNSLLASMGLDKTDEREDDEEDDEPEEDDPEDRLEEAVE